MFTRRRVGRGWGALLIFFGSFLFEFCMTSKSYAETIVTQRIEATRRLIPLKKLTVGPDDQYHGTVDPFGKTLVFTRKSDLVPHICTENLKTGEVKDFLPLTADSQDPAVSSDGKVAFTYFKYKATGDLCYRSIQSDINETPVCLQLDEGEPATPFWKNPREIGYLLKNTWTQNNQIVLSNLETGIKQVLAQGRIWSPALSPDGKYLFYNEMVGDSDHRVLIVKDLQTQKSRTIRINLPGISGFPAVSSDGRHLYFSHYLNDTNHDNVIDGKDNSVIFRATLESLEKEGEIFPEQLTSVENNCSFPRPHGEVIYVTCAFEGALDVYEMPATGVVPAGWDQEILNNSYQSSRTYSDRLLILNTLKFRYPHSSKKELDERILSNHLLADDLEAAKFTIRKLQQSETEEQKRFYQLLYLYLLAKEKKSTLKSEEVTASFQSEINEIESKIDQVNGYERFKKILKGLLRSYLNRPQESLKFLSEVQFRDSTRLLHPAHPIHPVERYFFFELASLVLPRVKSLESLGPVYAQMMKAPELSEETQLYYAYRYLESLGKAQHSFEKRISLIGQMISQMMNQKTSQKMPDSVVVLLKAEVATLKLIIAPADTAKSEAYRELDGLISTSRDRYYLKKTLSIRSILNFEQSADFKYLNFVASNWLRYTQNQDAEFIYARNVFSTATLEQAYDSLGRFKIKLASDYFYGSLSLTDDLESHLGYVHAMSAQNERKTIDERYRNLKNRKFIDDNMKFVEALLILIDARPNSNQDVKHFELALEKLKAMSQDRDSSVRYLLMGYCSLEILLRKGDGYEFDHDLFEDAHHYLMLAYDQGRGNNRIEATALMNLGLLHQRAQNHGLAAKFFSKRKALGFVSREDAKQLSWYYSRSLFFNHQADLASDQIKEVLELENISLGSKQAAQVVQVSQVPWLERYGFYLVAANRFEEAVSVYESILKSNPTQSQISLAKMNLNYGYSLFKAKKLSSSKKALQQALDQVSRLKVIPKGNGRWIQFDPLRIQVIAYGLLSQMGTSNERLDALEKRSKLLLGARSILDAEWFPSLIQNRLQVAQLSRESDPVLAAKSLSEALQFSEKYGDSYQYLSYAIYRAAVNSMIYAIAHSQLNDSESSEKIQKIIEKSIKVYDQQMILQPVLNYQKVMLQMLWSIYTKKALKRSPEKEVSQILESQASQGLKKALPEKWKELREISERLK
jgi:hypothetical protein